LCPGFEEGLSEDDKVRRAARFERRLGKAETTRRGGTDRRFQARVI
jgi:hypothetical protein